MTPQDLKQIGDLIDIKLDVHDEKLEIKLLKWKSDIVDAVDSMAKEIVDERDFRDIGSHQINSNTRRIEVLEKKVLGSVAI